MAKDWFTITVSRINESANKDPYETVDAHTLKLGPDGTLSISGGNGHCHAFSAGIYDGFEVKTLRMPKSGA